MFLGPFLNGICGVLVQYTAGQQLLVSGAAMGVLGDVLVGGMG